MSIINKILFEIKNLFFFELKSNYLKSDKSGLGLKNEKSKEENSSIWKST